MPVSSGCLCSDTFDGNVTIDATDASDCYDDVATDHWGLCNNTSDVTEDDYIDNDIFQGFSGPIKLFSVDDISCKCSVNNCYSFRIYNTLIIFVRAS